MLSSWTDSNTDEISHVATFKKAASDSEVTYTNIHILASA